jgi:hypothetical protein
LNGKLTLYCKRDATDQLRKMHGVSLHVLSRDESDGILTVAVRATTRDGRTDEDIGAVPMAGLKGEARCNAAMKAMTKAKRRVTLSICGLGMLDESELYGIPAAALAHVEKPAAELPALASDTADWLGDSIPALDPPSPESTPADRAESDTLRAEINASVPLDRPQRPSVRCWLQSLESRLAACGSKEETEALLLSNETCVAAKTLRGAARERLRTIMNGALERHDHG